MSEEKDKPQKKKSNTIFMVIIFIAAMILLYIWKFGVGTVADENGAQATETSAAVSSASEE